MNTRQIDHSYLTRHVNLALGESDTVLIDTPDSYIASVNIDK